MKSLPHLTLETHPLLNARKKKRKKKKKIKPVFPSKRIETEYRVGLFGHTARLYEQMLKATRWTSFTPERINGLISNIEKTIALSTSENGRANKLARAMVREGNKYNKKKNRLLWESAVGVSFAKIMDSEDIEEILQGRLNENISLIKSVSEEMRQRTEDVLWRFFNGQSNESLIDQLSYIYRQADNRVKTIARDQVSKFNAALNRQRQLNVGVEYYFWRTSQDERVRSSHSANEGERFAYDSPPEGTGHPGDDVNCRCTQEPDITQVLDKLGL